MKEDPRVPVKELTISLKELQKCTETKSPSKRTKLIVKNIEDYGKSHHSESFNRELFCKAVSRSLRSSCVYYKRSASSKLQACPDLYAPKIGSASFQTTQKIVLKGVR